MVPPNRQRLSSRMLHYFSRVNYYLLFDTLCVLCIICRLILVGYEDSFTDFLWTGPEFPSGGATPLGDMDCGRVVLRIEQLGS